METWDTLQNYSTDEQVVGTWIDGSKIYQKTFYHASPANKAWTTIGTISNFGRIINIIGTVVNNNLGATFPIGCLTNDVALYALVESDGILRVEPWRGNDTWKDVYVTVLYTKTTD